MTTRSCPTGPRSSSERDGRQENPVLEMREAALSPAAGAHSLRLQALPGGRGGAGKIGGRADGPVSRRAERSRRDAEGAPNVLAARHPGLATEGTMKLGVFIGEHGSLRRPL